MRIGLFTDCYKPIISGVTNSVDTLRKGLESLGHEVFVITNDHERAEDDPYVFRMGGVPLPMKGMREYRISKVTRKKVKRILALNLDIAHCHTEFTMGRLGRRVARKARIPIVLTYHTMYDDYVHFVSKTLVIPLRFLARWYIKGFANSAHTLIYPTIKVQRTFESYHIKTKSSIVPSGIPLERFDETAISLDVQASIKNKYGITDDSFVLLFLGRVSREKSINKLIDYVAKIKHYNVIMLIVGDGPDKELFEKQVKKLDASQRIQFTGMVAPTEVGNYYHIADLFVNFSVSETQGLTYLEALASGTPLLVKYDDNLEGVIENGTNGFAFNNDEEFLVLFEQIYSDPKLLQRLQKHASNAIEEYSADTYAKRIEEIYHSLIKG